MKPNFALSLSFEGIRLLHRTGAGPTSVWTLVGEVAIDAPDLASQLAMLRKTGLALDPQGLRTKLLIPNDQIKYLSLDTTRAGDDDVRAALDGATPYAVSDLTFDYVRGGGRTYIAAIARETLAEAEAFAAEHRFGPVCFAGVPAPFTYQGEPFFGPTSIAERLLGPGQRVERDDVAVAYQPKGRMTDRPVAPTASPKSELAEPDAAADMAQNAPRVEPDQDWTDPAPVDLPAPGLPDQNHAEVQFEVPADIQSEVPADVTPDIPAEGLVAESGQSSVNLPPPNPVSLDSLPQSPIILDETTAQSVALPNLPGQDQVEAPYIDLRIDPEADLPIPMAATDNVTKPMAENAELTSERVPVSAVVARSPLIPEPVFTSRGRPLRADPTDVPVMRQPLPAPLGNRPVQTDTAPDPVFSRRTEPPLMKPKGPDAGLPDPRPAGPVSPPPVMPMATDLAAVPPAEFTRGPMSAPRLTGAARQAAEVTTHRPFTAQMPPSAPAPVVTGQSAVARTSDAAPATVIPFRPHADPSDQTAGTPVSIQTVTLTPAKPALATAAITAPMLEPGRPGTFASRHGGQAQLASSVTSGMASVEAAPPRPTRSGRVNAGTERASGRGRPRYMALILTALLLAFLAAIAVWASYLAPGELAALFGRAAPAEIVQAPAEPSPLSVSDLSATTLIAPQDGAAETIALPAPDAGPDVAVVPGLAAPDSIADNVALEPSDPVADPAELAATVTGETGAVVSPAEAERIYAATGVWLRAPRLPLIPTADPVGPLGVASMDRGLPPVALPEMPALAGAAPDQSMLTPIDPPAPGTVFERDARGFIQATPEGTLTPEGILVFAGAPAIIPPNRPGTPEPVAVAQTAPRIIAASAPPLAPRPATAAPETVAPDTVSAEPAAVPPADPVATAGGVGLGSLGPVVRPLQRPDGLIPDLAQPEVSAPAPVLVAFAGPAPQFRPVGLTPQTVALPDPATAPVNPGHAIDDTVAAIMAAAPPEPITTEPITSDSPLAIASARIPEARPRNFADVVASAQRHQAPAEPQNPSLAVIDPPPEPPPEAPAPESVPEPPAAQTELLPESAIADETVAPSGPIPGGVAANATLAEAMDLRAVNLIGVFGRPNDRRALVRLANGSYVRVGVGDSLDGGQVAAIGDNALNYVKRGQTITIAIPNG